MLRRGALVWVSAGASLWGVDTILRAPLTSYLSSATIVLFEHLILAVALVPTLWIHRDRWLRLRWSDWLAVIGISWGGSALATYLFTEAVHQGNPTSAILLQKSQPIFAAFLSGAFLLEPLGVPFWSRLAVALAGAYLIQFGSSVPHVEQLFGAPLLALGAASLWGASTVLGRFLLHRVPFLLLTALRIIVALPPLATAAWLGDASIHPLLDWSTFLRLLMLALIPGLAGLVLYYRGLSHARASRASVAELCFPATAVVLNWYFLHVHVSIVQAVGFLLLTGAILSWERREPGAAKPGGTKFTQPLIHAIVRVRGLI
jgi:drug/metabolite transporter (DMT)-like permease